MGNRSSRTYPSDAPEQAPDSPKVFAIFFAVVQAVLILLFGLFTEYDHDQVGATTTSKGQPMEEIYPMFQDVHVMIFIGFGFLMTFLRKYVYSAVGFTFMVATFSIQWAILNIGFWDCVVQDEYKLINLEITK